MPSVTNRIKQIKQPRGGFLKPKEFNVDIIDDRTNLYDNENISPIIVGLAVDYLTRYSLNVPKEEAFRISLKGATRIGYLDIALLLLGKIKGLDYDSISSACRLCQFDVFYRTLLAEYKENSIIEPDMNTSFNIKTMVIRSLSFFRNYGNITMQGFNFDGGYTDTITSGDGDYLTVDTLWDFKVSKNEPTSKHTLQLLIYYLMGYQSIHIEFKTIEYLGIYNPRLNKVYRCKISEIDDAIIEKVAKEVIGYKDSKIVYFSEKKKNNIPKEIEENLEWERQLKKLEKYMIDYKKGN